MKYTKHREIFSYRKWYMLPYINRYLRANSEWRQITSLREWCLVSTEAETAHWFLDERDGSFLFQRIERHNDTCRHDTIKFPNRRPRYWEHSKANGCGFYEVIHRIQGYSVTNIPQPTFNMFLCYHDRWIFLERRRHRLHIILCTGWPLCLVTPAEMWTTSNFVSLQSWGERDHKWYQLLHHLTTNCCQCLVTRKPKNREDYEPGVWRFPETIQPRSPSTLKLLRWKQKLFTTGNIKYKPRTGMRSTRGGSANLSTNPLPVHHKRRPKDDLWSLK
jgi:hypothetical protein